MIFKTKLGCSAFCFAGLLVCLNVSAQTAVVSSVLTASIVSVVDGNTVKKPASDARPGDVIEYSTTYSNNSKAPIERLQASIPIPVGTTLIEKTAFPADITGSVDTVTFRPFPLMRTITSPSGGARIEPVPLSDYRAIRWALPTIPSGQKIAVSVNVRVNPTVQTAVLPTSTTIKP